MPLLPKGGLNIAGHKIPWEAVAAVAAVVSVLLVIRARQSGQNVASVGTPVNSPYSAAMTGFGNFSPDYSAQLANITQQLTTLEHSVNGPVPPPTPTPNPNNSSAPPPNLPPGIIVGPPQFTFLPRPGALAG